jgi:polar amino acid transport system permease protein
MDFEWDLFWRGLVSPVFLYGAFITIALAALSHAAGILLGTGLALGAMSRFRALRGVVAGYLWFFRATPTLLLLLLVWNALPQVIPILKEQWFSPFLAGFIALSLHQAAYQAEINRTALQSVPTGQIEAGKALGLTRLQVFFLITVPQAMRIAIPPSVNEFIALLKLTSLASVVSLQELLTITSQAVSTSFRFAEFYSIALVYYLAMVSALMALQPHLEARFDPARRYTKAGR